VLTETGDSIRCSLKGKFKKQYELKKDKLLILDVAAVGDFVKYELNEDGTGTIYEIADRINYLSRKSPKQKGVSFRGERLEQIIAANIDSLFIVASIKSPKFNNRLVDRIIVAGESSGIDIKIVINKIDLDNSKFAQEWKKFYAALGYDVFLTCAIKNEGTDKLTETLNGQTNIFWGSSGVGKSTLLNCIHDSLNLKVGEISESLSKGKHTTVTSVLKKIGDSTFVIDTPGLREIDPFGIKKQDLGHYFVEFESFINKCKFNTCTHLHEPGCAVQLGVQQKLIDERRYKSYLNMLDSIEEDIIF
jgi:ribosome biogenesis GTPase